MGHFSGFLSLFFSYLFEQAAEWTSCFNCDALSSPPGGMFRNLVLCKALIDSCQEESFS